ncbi:MAG TPA: hypothetical protein VJK51_04565 [Candidatus Nanoarchaeia archaeon]|nr:hypothetical protein [Candidatus Nanoarchaeia archaeon]
MKRQQMLVSVMLLFLFVGSVSAITASLGNSRMVLRLEKGEEVERYLTLKNVNDVPVTIDLDTAGELANSISLVDTSFILQPNEERRAYFTVKVSKDGQREGKINVRFTPPEGNGVGLSATIIALVGDGAAEQDEEIEIEPEITNTSSSGGFSFNPSGQRGNAESEEKSFSFSPIFFLVATTGVLIVVFVGVFVYYLYVQKSTIKPKEFDARK